MITNSLQQQARKIDEVIQLCVEADRYSDLRVVGYISRYLAILAASYVEIGTQEAFFEFARTRSAPILSRFVQNNIKRENSIDCDKIKKIMDKFKHDSSAEFFKLLDDNEKEAINSLKAMRDQLAHGHDNGTGYKTIERYHQLTKPFPQKLYTFLNQSFS